MEAKSGEASAGPAPAPMATAAAAAPVVTEATASFQSPAPAAAPSAAMEKGSSSGVLVSPPATGPPPAVAAGAGGALALGPVMMKVPKKRGRPRKYGPDGSLIRPLNATPISASAPMAAAVAAGQYTPASAVGAAMKRGRGRPIDFAAAAGKHHQHHQFHHHHQQQPFGFHFDSIGDMVACSAGANFTPHIITVAPGEDVTMKVISFAQQGPRAICVLSANGVISNVTLRQPDSSGGTLTYEGRFELLSLSGSFMPTENSGTRSRSGGMSVSLASPDGRVVGGGVAGLLVAASPVQIVVGSFLPSYQMEQKNKKARVDPTPTLPQTPPAIPIASTDAHSVEQGQHSSASHQRTTNIMTSAYGADQSWASQPTPEASRTPSGDQKMTTSGS
ncbi:hypothetical protein HU200_028483 [Digitaria exilis]|uniref:AT-hook motif nuclear-localized protein n=1 Tax=Digitaria exilis TaxID=1010633 RepID=A0A835EPX0_9POAL|nr:hypothetical protein HU200_028483 [Digitaria exilis]CAB3481952.1 unnamed protein product [Digitaria exilis]